MKYYSRICLWVYIWVSAFHLNGLALSPSTNTTAFDKYEVTIREIIDKMQRWFDTSKEVEKDEHTWIRPAEEMSDDDVQYHLRNFITAFKRDSLLTRSEVLKRHTRYVYHGTSLLNYLFLKHVGLMDIDLYGYLIEEIFNLDFDMGIDPGLFYSVRKETARVYALELTENYVQILKNTETMEQHLRPGLAFVMLLKTWGVDLNSPLVREMLSTPVMLNVDLKNAYPKSTLKMFVTRDHILDEPEIITVFPPADWRQVQVDLVSYDSDLMHRTAV